MRPEKIEFINFIKEEVYGNNRLNSLQKFQRRHITPNTNFVFLARKMWMHKKIGGGYNSLLSKLYYMRIYRKYGCCVFPDATIDIGFKIPHPVGIVIGRCNVGKNFTVLQGTTIGEKNIGEWDVDHTSMPMIGDDVTLAANVCVLGKVKIGNNILIGANSVVCNDILEQGNWVGSPARRILKKEK